MMKLYSGDLSPYVPHAAADALVADEQVAAAAQHTERHAFGVAAPHYRGKFFPRAGLDEHLGDTVADVLPEAGGDARSSALSSVGPAPR